MHLANGIIKKTVRGAVKILGAFTLLLTNLSLEKMSSSSLLSLDVFVGNKIYIFVGNCKGDLLGDVPESLAMHEKKRPGKKLLQTSLICKTYGLADLCLATANRICNTPVFMQEKHNKSQNTWLRLFLYLPSPNKVFFIRIMWRTCGQQTKLGGFECCSIVKTLGSRKLMRRHYKPTQKCFFSAQWKVLDLKRACPSIKES